MVTGVIIPADAESVVRREEFRGLTDYQRVVGGYIEAIDLAHPPMSLFANDEAKLIGLPINRRATALWWLHEPAAYGLDVVSGDVVLVGQPDRHGDTQSAPPKFVELLLTSRSFRVEVKGDDDSSAWTASDHRFDDYFSAATYALDLRHRWPGVSEARVIAD